MNYEEYVNIIRQRRKKLREKRFAHILTLKIININNKYHRTDRHSSDTSVKKIYSIITKILVIIST